MALFESYERRIDKINSVLSLPLRRLRRSQRMQAWKYMIR